MGGVSNGGSPCVVSWVRGTVASMYGWLGSTQLINYGTWHTSTGQFGALHTLPWQLIIAQNSMLCFVGLRAVLFVIGTLAGYSRRLLCY